MGKGDKIMKKYLMIFATVLLIALQGTVVFAKDKNIDNEPTNSFAVLSATPLVSGTITLGNNYSSSFTTNSNEKYYKFTINTSGRCEFKLVTTAFNHCWIDIYNTDYETEWEGETGIYAGNSRTVDLTKGTYYLRLKSSGEIGTFTFKTNFIPSGESYQDDNGEITKANSIVLGNNIGGQLAGNRKSDFYKFTLNTSGRTTFKLVSTELNHCWIDIYDTDYGTVWEGGSGIYAGNSRTVDLTDGTYYLRILSSGETGAYTLKTTYTPSNEDYKGDNGKINQANIINTNSTIKGQLAHNRKSDFYKFTLTSPQELKFKLTSTELNHCWIDIYDTDYGTVWEGGSGLYVGEERTTTLNNGTYILRIMSSGDTGAYSLQFTYNTVNDTPKTTVTVPSKTPSKISTISGTAKKKKITIKWKKVSDATGYKIVYSTSKKFKNKKVIYTNKKSVTIKKLKSKKRYYIKVCAYKVQNGKKTCGKYSKVITKKVK